MRKEIASKIKIMELLEQNGISTEEELVKLDTRRMLRLKNMNIPTMSVIVDMQEAVKNNRLFSYLLEQPQSQSEPIQKESTDENELYAE